MGAGHGRRTLGILAAGRSAQIGLYKTSTSLTAARLIVGAPERNTDTKGLLGGLVTLS